MKVRIGMVFAITMLIICNGAAQEKFNLLVFSKTNGFRHKSIEPAKETIKNLGIENNFKTSFTEDSLDINGTNLKNFQVVIFLSTTGDILAGPQEKALKSFVENGGGYVGIHAACDTEYEWLWYGKLVGRYFESHPNIQEARIQNVNKSHPSTESLPKSFNRIDEWYNFRNPLPEGVTVLLNLDERSYSGGTDNGSHPISWAHDVGKGRSFFTAMGHTAESYQEEIFVNHLLGGMLWAAGVR